MYFESIVSLYGCNDSLVLYSSIVIDLKINRLFLSWTCLLDDKRGLVCGTRTSW